MPLLYNLLPAVNLLKKKSINGQRYVLTVDLGTSGPKVGLVSENGEVIDYLFAEIPLVLLPGGGAEQEPHLWKKAILSLAKKILSRHRDLKASVKAVSCTAQWSGTVPVDRQGEPLMNCQLWMDSRGAPHIKNLMKGLITFEGLGLTKLLRWLWITGGAPTQSGKDTIAHILYIKNELPGIYQKTCKFLEPLDYLNMIFTGNIKTAYETATLTWLTNNRDINNISYSPALMKMAGLDMEKFPELAAPDAIHGTLLPGLAKELGISSDTPVTMGAPDTHSAAVGSGAVKDFQAHVYIGTSSWMLCHVPFKKTDVAHNMASVPSAIPGRYILMNEQETAGACLKYLRDNILYHKDELLKESRVPDVYKIFDRLAASVPAGSDGVIFTPWLYGERTPVDDHRVRACLFNQSLSTTRAHIVRAIFEGVAFNSRWLMFYLEKFIGRSLEAINIIGGGAISDIWCQIYADVLNRKIRRVGDPVSANLRGAAMIAASALKWKSFEEIADAVKIDREFTPNEKNTALYDRMFKEFITIYKKNKDIFRRLNSGH